MYHTTGLSREEIVSLCAMLHAKAVDAERAWPPILGLFRSVIVTVAYLRRNRVQAELAECYGVSQATISRAVAAVTPLLARVLAGFVPTADEFDGAKQFIVDGTLLPCWSWAAHPELYSGKHKTTGMNVQVACTLEGGIAWISDPVPGSRHDSYCLRESGILLTENQKPWIGDKGYVGNGMITPFKKPPKGELLAWQKDFNTQINKIRWVAERAIANFKTWRILHTGYRRPLATFAITISAVIGLYFYTAS